MSATWVRAQAFGQPLLWIEMSASKSRSRSSSRATSSSPRALVSTIASLQYSMPVQAIVPRRHDDGRAAHVVAPVHLLVDADVVDRLVRQLGLRAVDQLAVQVLLLQHLAELRH